MDKIKDQSSKVRKLIISGETGSIYKKALILTWNILRETGVLLWLVICLAFVLVEWFWKTSLALGLKARGWYEEVKTPSNEEPKSASEMGQSVLTALNSSTENLLYQAKQQLGIDAEPPAPKPVAPKAIAKPKAPEAPSVEATAPPPPTPVAAAPDATAATIPADKGSTGEEE
ncbi:MAG: hypothetical protein F6J95_003265 [Leptolyngbya sp. SIO1E4]|nr:hypothetical protein [Leptolyngbya sp. SIO1E4]